MSDIYVRFFTLLLVFCGFAYADDPAASARFEYIERVLKDDRKIVVLVYPDLRIEAGDLDTEYFNDMQVLDFASFKLAHKAYNSSLVKSISQHNKSIMIELGGDDGYDENRILRRSLTINSGVDFAPVFFLKWTVV